jgi:MFS family permease
MTGNSGAAELTTPEEVSPSLDGPSRFILNAALVSKLGNQVLNIAIPIVLLHATGSARTALLGFTVQTLPLMFSPVLGVIIDRYDQLRLYAAGEAFQLICITGLAFTFTYSTPLALVIMLIASVAGVASSIMTNFVIIPAFVGPKALPRVNGYFTGGSQLIAVVGLPLGGLIIVTIGARAAMLIDAATFIATITAGLLAAKRGNSAPQSSAPPLTAIAEGLRFVRRNTTMLRLGIVLGLINLGIGSLSILVLTQAEQSWGWGTSAAGGAMAVDAIGATAGAVLAGRRISHSSLISGLILSCGGTLLMIPFGSTPFLLIGLFVMAFGVGLLNVRSITFRQLQIPPELKGRVNALLRMVILGTVPLSALIQFAFAGLPIWARLAVPAATTIAALATWLAGEPGAVRLDMSVEKGIE